MPQGYRPQVLQASQATRGEYLYQNAKLSKMTIFLTICLTLLCFLSDFGHASENSSEAAYLDYNTLDHRILISKLRSGNHDLSGQNHYIFTVVAYALAMKPSERNKSFDDRLKLAEVFGTFGEKILPALSLWVPEDDKKPTLEIKGDAVRDLIAKAMRKFDIEEKNISLLIEIVMTEKNKKFFVLNDDKVIGKKQYYLIPETLPYRPQIDNKSFELTDPKGTYVSLNIEFNPVVK